MRSCSRVRPAPLTSPPRSPHTPATLSRAQVDAVREWFTWYKATSPEGERIEGAEPNIFEFEGAPLDTSTPLLPYL